MALALFAILMTSLLLVARMGVGEMEKPIAEARNERQANFLHLYFQDQALLTDVLYIRNNILYFRDQDLTNQGTGEIYNYYYLNDENTLLRVKVLRPYFTPIKGGSGQFAAPLKGFALYYEPETKLIHLSLTFIEQSGKLKKTFRIYYPGEVVYV